MIFWSITFFAVSLICAFMGFTGLAGDLSWLAKVLFVVFLSVFLSSLLFVKEYK